VAVRDEGGRFVGMSLSIGPADARARDQRSRRERDQAALETTGDDVWDWDIAGRRVYCSARWSAALRLGGRREMSSREYRERMHPDDLAHAEARVRDYFSGRVGEFRAEYRLRHADGHWLWVLARGRVVSWSPDGKPLRMVGAHVDVTAYKDMESRLRDR